VVNPRNWIHLVAFRNGSYTDIAIRLVPFSGILLDKLRVAHIVMKFS